MHASVLALVLSAAPGQTLPYPNLDFSLGNLEGWEGQGFYATAGGPRGPGSGHGVCSSDGGNPARTGLLRHVLVVPPGTGFLIGRAHAAYPPGEESGGKLEVVLADAHNRLVPRKVRTAGGWAPAPALLPRWQGDSRTYSWDVSHLQGRTLQVALIDRDARPGRHVFATGFRLVPGQDFADEQFVADMSRLQARHELFSFTRYEGKRFTALSNAGETYSSDRVRFCEVFYDLFFAHFRDRGFRIHPPPTRLMLAIFDGPEGFEAYLGRSMPSGVTGIYEQTSNRLILYDVSENRFVVKSRATALKQASRFARNETMRRLRVDKVTRQFDDLSRDVNLSTTMHEAAHQISFNCGLLRRDGDVPIWLAEGLACYCEATSDGDWQALGSVNPSRLDALRPMLAGRGSLIPLRSLIVSDRWREGRQVLTGYAQSWALFHQLMHQRPQQLRRYLETIRQRQGPDHRLADFLEVFGADLEKMERDHRAYLRHLAERTPRAQLR